MGCGRGEFLELLLENGIDAKGVDIYEEFAQMCSMRGLDVIRDDALSFLDAQQKVGGIFAGQLIEHLTVNQLVKPMLPTSIASSMPQAAAGLRKTAVRKDTAPVLRSVLRVTVMIIIAAVPARTTARAAVNVMRAPATSVRQI